MEADAISIRSQTLQASSNQAMFAPTFFQFKAPMFQLKASARLAQSAERKALNLVVVGSSPTVGVFANGGGLAILGNHTPPATKSARWLCLSD